MFKKSKLTTIVGQRQLNRRISKILKSDFENIVQGKNVSHADHYSHSNTNICLENELEGSHTDQYDNNIDTTQDCSIVFCDDAGDNLPNFGNSPQDLEDKDVPNLTERLQSWAVNEKVSHSAVTSLLHILHEYHSFLPMDCRTLLKTPRQMKTKKLFNGEYLHFSLTHTLKHILNNSNEFSNNIFLSFNIDGLPIFQSSTLQFWPILCS